MNERLDNEIRTTMEFNKSTEEAEQLAAVTSQDKSTPQSPNSNSNWNLLPTSPTPPHPPNKKPAPKSNRTRKLRSQCKTSPRYRGAKKKNEPENTSPSNPGPETRPKKPQSYKPPHSRREKTVVSKNQLKVFNGFFSKTGQLENERA